MENKEFKTRDFYLAACLLAYGLVLKKLQLEKNKIATFIFNDPNNIAEKIITDHWNRKNKIPTRDLIEAIVELKTRIHNGI